MDQQERDHYSGRILPLWTRGQQEEQPTRLSVWPPPLRRFLRNTDATRQTQIKQAKSPVRFWEWDSLIRLQLLHQLVKPDHDQLT